MHIAVTANGPGEVAGWLRPLLRALYARRPDLGVLVFLVPDDYASGFEAEMVREVFPQARVYEPKSYVKFALGGKLEGAPPRVDLVQYIGGDLLHAAIVHRRLKGRTATYKFSRRTYRKLFERAFAVDERNAGQLAEWGTPREHIVCVGNLAIDGALFEASLPAEAQAPHDGILIMPGSRAYEVESMVPFFFSVALQLQRERPEIPVALALSPFTARSSVQSAIESGGHPRMFGKRGKLVSENGCDYLTTDDDRRIPVLRNGLAAAKVARMVLTIPGTKTIELAILGKPTVAITPLNAPELVTINGPLTYLDRVPFVGLPLKRAAVTAVSHRFKYHTQPNMDAGRAVVKEIHSTITPARMARIALESYDDVAWLAEVSPQLAALYHHHVGASGRMAESLLELAA